MNQQPSGSEAWPVHRGASLLAGRRRPLAGKGLSHQVSEDLLVRIGAGEFRPGEKLPGEVELMDEYGVGRNTVREAIRGLVALRVVDVRPRRGMTVLAVAPDLRLPIEVASALVSDKMTDDLYEMRLVLETEAAGRAAGRRDPAELGQIRYYHDLYEQMTLAGSAPWLIDLKFHAAIARASGNSVLPLMLEGAHDLLKRERFANSLIVPESVAQVYQEHGAILEAIEAGRRRDARKLMSDHIKRVAGSLRCRRDEERDAGGLVPPPRRAHSLASSAPVHT
jgi:GntR family transcriptional repressor for pyruvate dehydrogenase complex